MDKKSRELLIRLDQKMDTVQGSIDKIFEDNTDQWKVINQQGKIVEQHKSYFKVAAWIFGSGTAITVIVNGVLALVR